MPFSSDDLDYATEVVRRCVPATPQYTWPLLSAVVGTQVWVKHENHTPTGAFKVRGGLVYADRLRARRPGVTGIGWRRVAITGRAWPSRDGLVACA